MQQARFQTPPRPVVRPRVPRSCLFRVVETPCLNLSRVGQSWEIVLMAAARLASRKRAQAHHPRRRKASDPQQTDHLTKTCQLKEKCQLSAGANWNRGLQRPEMADFSESRPGLVIISHKNNFSNFQRYPHQTHLARHSVTLSREAYWVLRAPGALLSNCDFQLWNVY